MKRVSRPFACLTLLALIVGASSCSNSPDPSQANRPQSNANASVPSGPPKTAATGTLTAIPNPIQVCDGTKLGLTTISWTVAGTNTAELRVGKPDGDLFGQVGASGMGPTGTRKTGKWVVDGTVFYLQDTSDGKPLTANNTIATVTVNLTSAGCP